MKIRSMLSMNRQFHIAPHQITQSSLLRGWHAKKIVTYIVISLISVHFLPDTHKGQKNSNNQSFELGSGNKDF